MTLQVTPVLLVLAVTFLHGMVKAQTTNCATPPNSTLVTGATWPSNCAGFPQGGTCTGSCGDAPNGRTQGPIAICRDGAWALYSITTVEWCFIGCPNPPPLKNNIAQIEDCTSGGIGPLTPHDGDCDAACAPGWRVSQGPLTVKCQEGLWNITGSCYRPCTGPPPPSNNVAWNCPAEVEPDGVCVATCAAGNPDSVQGAPTAICQSNGQWTVTSGRCATLPPAVPGCPDRPSSSLASNTLWDQCAAAAIHGAQCRGVCAPGSKSDAATGAPVAMCSNGGWILLGGACVADCSLTFGNSNGLKARTARVVSRQQQVCPDATSLMASFPYTAIGVADLQFTATATTRMASPSNMRCIVDSASVAATAKVTCTPVNSQLLTPGQNYTVQLTANYKCDSRQTATATAVTSTTVMVGNPVQVSLLRQGPSRMSFCSSGGPSSVSFTYGYRVVNSDADSPAQLSVSASAATAQGVGCSAELRKGVDTVVNGSLVSSGEAVITCTGDFAFKSDTVVTTRMAATPQGCSASTATMPQRISASCCQHGVSYARPRKGGSINCFQHFYPNTTCPSDAPTLHGVFSQGPGSNALTLYDTAAQRCAGLATVGSVDMICDNDKLASFTLVSRNMDLDAVQYVMFTCDRPKRKSPGTCPGSIVWTKIDTEENKPVISGDKTELAFTAMLPADASCRCEDAFWTVQQSAMYKGLPPRLCGR